MTDPTPTKPVPVSTDDESVGDERVIESPPPRRRRRWPWVLGGVLVGLVVLLTIAFFVADAYAKDAAREYIKQRIIAVLGVEEGTAVTVDIGTGSVLLQALRGEIDVVDVTVESVTFGALTGAATVHAEGVPLNEEAPTRALDITFSVAEADLGTLAGNLSGAQLESITLEEPEIVTTTTFSFFGIEFPVGMGIEPSADAGQIVFTPTSIRLGDETYSAEQLRASFGGFVDQLLQQQSLCVNESLPVALTVVDVDVEGDALVLAIDGAGAALGGEGLTTLGTCPAP